jgi:class 3 adenylate cyclase/tetratricopeptide (TPR) repeat protein
LCATPFAPDRVARTDERKVITALYADMVGSTARSERLDVEEVRDLIVRYHDVVRAELERYGGTVEKFIGDGVVALFGAPVAHEDDPERAVRAALSIQDAMAKSRDEIPGFDVHVRIGVNTGEALVAPGSNPAAGEYTVSGDVVNTAARLQAAAPVDGVVVGALTYRTTKNAIDYDDADPIAAKGKAEKVPLWVANGAKSAASDADRLSRSPLVGRDEGLGLLVRALDWTREQSLPQLVTLIGVPGMGKSRLTWEFSQRREVASDSVRWLQGRSLPYGDGVTFWALGEMIKSHAGILHSDAAEVAAEKLDIVVADVLPDDGDARWVLGHLRPLAGLRAGRDEEGDRQAEAFAAWCRFLEALAGSGPLVLVFEDVHWADDTLLDFIDHLVGWASGVPLFVLCTARPELLDRRVGWGGGRTNATTVQLSPLSDQQAGNLVTALLNRDLAASSLAVLLERIAGNPLYAQEYARMLVRERRAGLSDGDRLEGWDELPAPGTLQAVIAARLDTLPSDEKAILQNASVVGKVAWVGAVAHVADLRPWEAEAALRRLQRKEFLHQVRPSSVAGETEYAFRHDLIRDAAYAQIPRGARAEKHRRVAEWIERLSGDREDRLEVLVHHYRAALSFATSGSPDASELRRRARQVMAGAGDRAIELNAFAAAARFFSQARELWHAEDAEYPDLLYREMRALERGLRFDQRTLDIASEAVSALVRLGDRTRAAQAENVIATVARLRGDVDGEERHHRHAGALIADGPPSRAQAEILGAMAARAWLAGRADEAVALGEKAQSVAKELGLLDVYAAVTNDLGQVRLHYFGDTAGGLEAIREGLAIGQQLRSPSRIYLGLVCLADAMIQQGDLAAAFAFCSRASEPGKHLPAAAEWLERYSVSEHYWRGDWREAFDLADRLLADDPGRMPHYLDAPTLVIRGRIRLAQGDAQSARADGDRGVAAARTVKDPGILIPALAFSARVLRATDEVAQADHIAHELVSLPGVPAAASDCGVDLACAVGKTLAPSVLELIANAPVRSPWLDALTAFFSGDYQRSAETYATIGTLPDEAYARLQAGVQLIDDGSHAQGQAELERALAFWRRVDGSAYVDEAEAALLATTHATHKTE